jgi:isopropylmalate/homocitrate/citramalate synthase
VTGWFKNAFEKNPTTVFPVRPEFVGHDAPKIVMGKKSGADNVEIWTKKLGIQLNEEETLAVLQEVKLKSHDLKRVLDEGEFKEIVKKVKAGR